MFFIDKIGTSAPRNPSDFPTDEPSTRASKLGHFHYVSWWSVLTPRDVDRLPVGYAILENVAIRIPGPDAGAEPDDKTHEVYVYVCVYEQMFKASVQFSFLPMIWELFSELR